MNILYDKVGNVFLIPNNYDHSLKQIELILESAEKIGLTLPSKENIRINVLRGERFNGMISVEFNSITLPNIGTLLESESPLWEWLKY